MSVKILLLTILLTAALSVLPACLGADNTPVALSLGGGIGMSLSGDVEVLALTLSTRASDESLATISNWQPKGDLLKGVKFVAKTVARNGRLYIIQRGVGGVKVSLGLGAQMGVPRLDVGIYQGDHHPMVMLKYDLFRYAPG